MTVMLYKAGKAHKLHGFDVDTVIVEDGEVDAHLKDGWVKTPAATASTYDLDPSMTKPKRKRRTKAEMAAARAKEAEENGEDQAGDD